MTTLTISDSRAHCGGYQWTLGNIHGTHISNRRPEPRDWPRMEQMWEDQCYRLCRIPRRLRKAAKMTAGR